MSHRVSYTVSPGLLAREDFRDACAARDFAKLFLLMRKYDGVSQDRLSSPVEGFGQSRVSKIMRGEETITSLSLIERIIDALRIPGAYFGFLPRDWEVQRDAADVRPTNRIAPPVPHGPDQPAVPGEADPAAARVRRVGRPVGLRPHIERAFERNAVTIDFAGFSGETLAGALVEPLDKVRSGELTPSTIRIRILVPDTSLPWAFPCRMDDLGDEPAFRARTASISDRSLSSIVDAIADLEDLGAVGEATAEVRVHRLAPQFKLYLINDTEVFFGFYPIIQHMVRLGETVHAMYDVLGKDSVLFHHSTREQIPQASAEADPAAAYVAQSRLWFESVWVSVARDRESD